MKIATARVLGMAEVITARDQLVQLLDSKPSLPVARQVATALGQIGDPKATQSLLSALKRYPSDRYFEHAVIFALIEMKNEDQLREELSASGFHKALLIALDQKGKGLLQEKRITPFLVSNDSTEMNTAVWILKNHPDWSRAYRRFLDTFSGVDSNRELLLRELWPSFIDQESVQEYISKKLISDTEQSKWILSMLASFPPRKVSPSLRSSLRQHLTVEDTPTKEAVLQVITQLATNDFNQVVATLARSDSEKDAIRLMAYQSLIGQGEKISEQEFQWITLLLLSNDHRSIHSLVLRIVKNMPMDQIRMDWILDRIFPDLSTELIPGVLEIFDGVTHSVVLEKLERQLLRRKEVWDHLSIGLVKRIFSNDQQAILDSLERVQELRLQKLESVEKNWYREMFPGGESYSLVKAPVVPAMR